MSNNSKKRTLSENGLSDDIKRLVTDDSVKENIPPRLLKLSSHIKSELNLENTHYTTENKNTTPKKSHQNFEDPVTPSTNFKLLTSLAAARDYANCNTPKSRRNSEVYGIQVPCDSDVSGVTPVKINRKEKSLAIICTRFLAMFPTYPLPNEKIIVSLDEVCYKLGIERRRLYDIVNVFESVDILCKNAKNQYLWFGKNKLFSALLKLKEEALKENILEKLQYVMKSECLPNCKQSCMLSEVENFNRTFENPELSPYLSQSSLELRKEKSLGIMSQKFLMLFLVSPNKVISLGVAAKVLHGFVQRNEKAAQVKTQIRRLYDIANVLSSIGLIQKQVAFIRHSRKPAFKYIGPDLQNPKDDLFLNTLNKSEKPRSLARHSSFQEICAVAEIEHQKLNLRESPKSAPPFENSMKLEENPKTNFKNVTLNDTTCFDKKPIVVPEKNVITPVSKAFTKNPVSLPSKTVPCIVLSNIVPRKPGVKHSNTSTVLLFNPLPPKEIKVEHPDTKIEQTSVKAESSNNQIFDNSNSRTIILSSEQRNTILQSLNISLSPEEIASIHIDGDLQSSDSNISTNVVKIINKNTFHKNLEHEEKYTKSIYPKHTPIPSDGLITSSNTINNSCNSSQATDSPLSIPSGYVTPVPVASSDIMFVSNNEVNDILKRIENHQNISVCNINQQNSKMFQTSNESFLSQQSSRIESERLVDNHCSKVETVKEDSKYISNNFSNDSCSSDSVNLEVSDILKGKNFGERSPKSKTFLIDEKTILSPINKSKTTSNYTTTSNLITPPYIVPDTIFVFSTPLGYQTTTVNNASSLANIIIPHSTPSTVEKESS